MDDRELQIVFGSILGLLLIATAAGWIMRRRAVTPSAQQFADQILARTKAWWIMCVVFVAAVVGGSVTTVVLFGLVSFLALREFVAVASPARADHRALFWLFFLAVPIQYYLVYIGWYGLFAIFVPVYAFQLTAIRITIAQDCERYLERVAKILWGLMICVYCVSYVPAILQLNLKGFAGQNVRLLMYFVVVVECCDVLQFVCGKLLGRRKILPGVSPNKTWEGFIGGVLLAALLGTALSWMTPFSPLQAFAIAAVIGVMGFFGDVTLSAVKRDADLKDYGQLLPGHGGILDRIDSLCFAAPVFFHLTRFYFSGQPLVGF